MVPGKNWNNILVPGVLTRAMADRRSRSPRRPDGQPRSPKIVFYPGAPCPEMIIVSGVTYVNHPRVRSGGSDDSGPANDHRGDHGDDDDRTEQYGADSLSDSDFSGNDDVDDGPKAPDRGRSVPGRGRGCVGNRKANRGGGRGGNRGGNHGGGRGVRGRGNAGGGGATVAAAVEATAAGMPAANHGRGGRGRGNTGDGGVSRGWTSCDRGNGRGSQPGSGVSPSQARRHNRLDAWE